MAARHWLIGCGLGCGAILLVIVGLGVASTLFVRDTVEGFNEAVETRAQLDEQFGAVDEFTPAPDGAIAADRLETFLAIREATSPARDAIVAAFAEIPMSEEQARELESAPFFEKMRSIFGIVGSAAGLGGDLGDFFDARNRAMLDAGMGMGEYTYIYVVAYYSWLGHSPDDAPENAQVGTDSGSVTIRRDDAIPTGLGGISSHRIRRDVIAILRSQLDALGEDADPAWRERLTDEIDTLEENAGRVPWRGEVPDSIAASLEPFRDRLEAAYDPMTNSFELLRNKRRGRFSIQAE
jgi:hypothetical protein